MVKIDSDSAPVAKAISTLLASLQRHGANFNDRLTVCCRGNDLSLHMRAAGSPRAPIMGLPAECLLPVDEFRLALSGATIEVAEADPTASPARREILERVVEVLNLTDKVTQHRHSTPASLRRTLPEVYGRLCSGRLPPGQEPPIHPSHNDPAIDDLLDTRTLVHRFGPASDPTLVMMPLMDFCNHHPLAYPFSSATGPDGQPLLTIRPFYPDSTTRECCVRYGIYDAYDCLLHYGFAERRAPFVISIPLEISLPSGGRLTVRARAMPPPPRSLPKAIADLKFYIPTFAVDPATKSAVTSHLMIPQQNAPYALRRVLALILGPLELAPAGRPLAKIIEEIEEQILSANWAFYNDLTAYLRSTTLPDDFSRLRRTAQTTIDLQLEKLQGYPFFSPT